MKKHIYAMPCAGNQLFPQNSRTYRRRASSSTVQFKSIAVLLFFAALPLKTNAQCACNISVGSGVGVPNLSQVPALLNLTGGCVRVIGTFTVNNNLTWTLRGVDVRMNANSDIVVQSGCTLDVDDDAGSGAQMIFEGCNNQDWNRITVSAGAIIKARNTDFRNANKPIVVAGSPEFRLNDNIFEKGTPCLTIFGAQNIFNHTVQGNRFTGTMGIEVGPGASHILIRSNRHFGSGNVPIGMRINTNAWDINVVGVSMINMGRGFDILGAREVTIMGIAAAGFNAIQGNEGVNALNTKGTLSVTDCAIRANVNCVTVKNHTTGFADNITVSRNILTSFTATGVSIQGPIGNGQVEIEDNTISPEVQNSINPSFLAYGIAVENVQDAFVFVNHNTINHSTPNIPNIAVPGGIYLFKCRSESVVLNNTVHAVGPTSQFLFGISVAESPHVQVVDNNVNGGPNITQRAISVENTPDDILLCCNILDQAVKGLYMLGAHDNCEIYNTNFNQHTEALYYDMVVSQNAPQFHRGNNWGGAATTWDGYYNGNWQFAQFVFYTVDPVLLPNGLNKIFVTGGSPGDWFLDDAGNESVCASNGTYCGNAPFDGELQGRPDDELTGNDHWAANPLTDATYAWVYWEAQKNLYAKLMRYPALQNQSADVAAFFAAAQNGTIHKLWAVQDGLRRLREPGASIATEYHNAQSALAAQYGALRNLETQIETAAPGQISALQSQWAAKAAEIDATTQTIIDYEAIIEDAVPQKLADLQTINTSISSVNDWENNERNMNSLLLTAMATNDWDFGEAEKSAIDAVAGLCPQTGGSAVFEARQMQESYRVPTWNMDCSPSTQLRNEQTLSKRFVVFPNPAAQEAQVTFALPLVAESRLSLFSLTGQLLWEQALSVGTTNAAIPVGQYPNGTYFVRVNDGTAPQKLTILR